MAKNFPLDENSHLMNSRSHPHPIPMRMVIPIPAAALSKTGHLSETVFYRFMGSGVIFFSSVSYTVLFLPANLKGHTEEKFG